MTEVSFVTRAGISPEMEEDAPMPEPLLSGSGFSTLDQTLLAAPYRSPGQSSLPTEHLQPGYCPLVAPYAFSPGYHLFQPFPVPIDPSVTYSLMPSDLRAHVTALTDKVAILTQQLDGRDQELKIATESLSNHVQDNFNIRCRYLIRKMESLEMSVRKQINQVYATLLEEFPGSEPEEEK